MPKDMTFVSSINGTAAVCALTEAERDKRGRGRLIYGIITVTVRICARYFSFVATSAILAKVSSSWRAIALRASLPSSKYGANTVPGFL